jgi:hypothetical protein
MSGGLPRIANAIGSKLEIDCEALFYIIQISGIFRQCTIKQIQIFTASHLISHGEILSDDAAILNFESGIVPY